MNKLIYNGLALAVAASLTGCINSTPSTNTSDTTQVQQIQNQAVKINFNQNWQFAKSEQNLANDKLTALNWQTVGLPHTPKIEPLLVNDQFQGYVWYQKNIEFKPEWQNKKVLIRFEAAMNIADIYLNGEKIGHHKGGYLPFTLDLTDKLQAGSDNTLLVKLDNTDSDITGPKPLDILDFNTYGGLYRDVNLLIKNPLHITDEMLSATQAGGGIFVTFPQVAKAQSKVNVQTEIANDSQQAASFDLVQRLVYQGEVVAEVKQNKQLAAGQKAHINQQVLVKNAQLWSPNSPNLYQLETQIWQDDKLVESKQTQIGIREFKFNDKHELLINGEKTFLRGVNRHQEYPHVGYATSPEADYRDAVKIKSAGFDYVRLSHYPHSPAFMQAADELGLVLIDAILGWQYVNETPEFEAQVVQTCRDMIRRDRNHASVLAWECSLNESWMKDELIAKFNQAVDDEYPNSYSAGWQLGYDIYLQARQHRMKHYETPTYPYNVSEYGDWEYYAQNAGLNQDSWADLKESERTSRQLLSAGEKPLLQQATNLQEAHNDNLQVPAFADGYWVMFDYNRGYADDLEASGIMSIYRLPKYSYYFYQSQRDADIQSDAYQSYPMVHIASEWTENSSTNVRVFSNAEEVELWLNDKLIAKQQPNSDKLSTHLPHPPFEFKLAEFKPGSLTAKAFIDGKQVATHQVTTPGKVASVELSLDTSTVAAAANDVVFVYAKLLDHKGNLVPANGVEIEFSTQGDIELINPQTPFTEQGIATAVIKTGSDFKQAKITATSKQFNVSTADNLF